MRKKMRLIKNVSINLFQRIYNLVTQSVLKAIYHIGLSIGCKNKKEIYFNLSIN